MQQVLRFDPQVPVLQVGKEHGTWVVWSADVCQTRVQGQWPLKNHTSTEEIPDQPRC